MHCNVKFCLRYNFCYRHIRASTLALAAIGRTLPATSSDRKDLTCYQQRFLMTAPVRHCATIRVAAYTNDSSERVALVNLMAELITRARASQVTARAAYMEYDTHSCALWPAQHISSLLIVWLEGVRVAARAKPLLSHRSDFESRGKS